MVDAEASGGVEGALEGVGGRWEREVGAGSSCVVAVELVEEDGGASGGAGDAVGSGGCGEAEPADVDACGGASCGDDRTVVRQGEVLLEGVGVVLGEGALGAVVVVMA
jgi:hypothetical protein